MKTITALNHKVATGDLTLSFLFDVGVAGDRFELIFTV